MIVLVGNIQYGNEEIMASYVLTCCSTADRSEDFFKEKDIPYACFHFKIGDKEYKDDLGKSIPFDEFYKLIKEGAMPVTAQVNSSEFVTLWEPYLKEGKDILHVSLSSGISGVFNSANIAKNMLNESYPDRKIYVVDSFGASSGYGLLMEYLADLRDEGMTIEEVYRWAENNKLNMHHWFFSTDLTSYKRGGRISATSAVVGTVLGICPLMNMDNLGRLIPREKIRTKKKVIKEIVNKMEEHVQDGLEYTGKCAICESDCFEDAQEVRSLIEEKFPQLKWKISINSIGTVIGSHTGPGTVAVFFMGDKRED